MGKHTRLSQVEALKEKWRDLRSRIKRLPAGTSRVSMTAIPWPKLDVYFGGERARRLFFFTKEYFCRDWLLEKQPPRDWSALVRRGIPSEHYIASVQRHARTLRLPVLFVGDLSVEALANFLALRLGSPDLELRHGSGLPVQYLGVDDRLLALAEGHRAPGRSIDEMSSPLRGEYEPEQVDLLCELIPDLERLVGPRCFSLFKSYRALGLEVLSTPSSYVAGYAENVRHHLRTAPGKVWTPQGWK